MDIFEGWTGGTIFSLSHALHNLIANLGAIFVKIMLNAPFPDLKHRINNIHNKSA